MRPGTLIFLIVLGMFLGSFTILGSCLGSVFMFTRPKETQASRPETVEIFIASQEIPEGALLTQPERLFEPRSVPKGSEPPGAVTNLEHIRNGVLTRKLTAGEHCCRKDLVTDDGYIAALPPGLRATAIRVIAEDGGRFIVPGCRADVMVRGRSNEEGVRHKVLLQDILVLVVNGPEAVEGAKDATLSASVAVTPEQAEKLADALVEGPVRLLVRPPGASRK